MTANWRLIGAALAAALASLAHGQNLLENARRVVFLGDSITYSGQFVEYIEGYFKLRFPERSIEFLNLGLPSETVSGLSEQGHAGGQFPRPDLHERLSRVLDQAKPDTIIACYGMNDGIYLPFSTDRFAAFTNGMIWLRTQALAHATIIHVTPPPFDESRGKGPGYADTLDRYSNWLLSRRADRWDVADVHGAMKDYLDGQRKKDPTAHLAGDGVHPGEIGHWIMARSILQHLGAADVAAVPDPRAMVARHPNGEAILKLVQDKQRLLKDAWLTATGHRRPGMKKGLPIKDATTRANEIDQRIRDLIHAR